MGRLVLTDVEWSVQSQEKIYTMTITTEMYIPPSVEEGGG